MNVDPQLLLEQEEWNREPYVLQFVTPHLSHASFFTMECQHLNLMKENEKNIKSINVMRGTLAFNDRMRLLNMKDLLKIDFEKMNDMEFKRLLLNISLQMDAMDITTFWKKFDGARTNPMFKALNYVSRFHYFNFEDELWKKMDIEVAKKFLNLLSEAIDKMIDMESKRDVLIELTNYLSQLCCNGILKGELWKETRRYRTTYIRVISPDLIDTISTEKQNEIIASYNSFSSTKQELINIFKKKEENRKGVVKEVIKEGVSKIINEVVIPFGQLYEVHCLKYAYTAIRCLDNKEKTPTFEIILQCIVVLGETFNQSNYAPENVDLSPSIAACVIKLRNKIIHSNNEFHQISERYWKRICEELLTIADKIKTFLDHQQNDVIKSLYRVSSENEKMKPEEVRWLQDDYEYLRDFQRFFHFRDYPEGKIPVSLTSQKEIEINNKKINEQNLKFDEIANIIINNTEILEKLCIKLNGNPIQQKHPLESVINEELEKQGNDCRLFLQLTYYIVRIFQYLRQIIENQELFKNVKEASRKGINKSHLFDHILIQFCNSRNALAHGLNPDSYKVLSSLICLLVSNLKPILIEQKRTPNSETLDLWWHLIFIKGMENVTMRNEPVKEFCDEEYPLTHRIVDDKGVEEVKNVFRMITHHLFTVDEEKLDDEIIKHVEKYGWEIVRKKGRTGWYLCLDFMVKEISNLRKNANECNRFIAIEELKRHIKSYDKTIDFDFSFMYDRTPLAYVLSLYDNDNTINQASELTYMLTELLLIAGADPNKCTPLTLHPMHYAALASENHMDLLKKYGAISNPCDGMFEHTSDYYFNNYQFFRVMLSNPNERKNIVQDSFFNRKSSADKLHNSFPNFVIDRNYYPSLYNHMGQLPLTCAILSGYELIYFKQNCQILLDMGADINKQEILMFSGGQPVYGASALIKAADYNSNMTVIKYLLDKNADVNAESHEYNHVWTAMEYVQKNIFEAKNEQIKNEATKVYNLLKEEIEKGGNIE